MAEDVNSAKYSSNEMVLKKSKCTWTSTSKTEKIDSKRPNNSNHPLNNDASVHVSNIKTELVEVGYYLDNFGGDDHHSTNLNYSDPLKIQKPRRKRSLPKIETKKERADRLAKMSANAARRIAMESPEQRALRLRRMSEYAAKRLAIETSEQRAIRLAKMSEYTAKRIANETKEQREVRLAKMSLYAARRQAKKKALLNTINS